MCHIIHPSVHTSRIKDYRTGSVVPLRLHRFAQQLPYDRALHLIRPTNDSVGFYLFLKWFLIDFCFSESPRTKKTHALKLLKIILVRFYATMMMNNEFISLILLPYSAHMPQRICMFALSLALSFSPDLEIPLKKCRQKQNLICGSRYPHTNRLQPAEHFAKHFADRIRNNNQPEQR